MVIIPGPAPALALASASASAAAPRRRAGQRAAGFEVPEGDDLPPTAPAAPASALSGLLAMQEAAIAATGDRAAQNHAEAVMHELGAFQLELLRGQPGAAASRLAGLARATPHTFDPGLAALLGAVRLRAEVEAARSAMAPPPTLRRQGDT